MRNHFTASLSTLASGIAHRQEFLDYQKEFYAEASAQASKDVVKGYVFGSSKDPIKNFELVKMLTQHEVEVYELKNSMSKNGKQFEAGSAYVVPMNQPQYRLAKAIFETRTSFNDSLFYDVSTWTMPLAFNLNYADLGSKDLGSQGSRITNIQAPKGELIGGKGAYAYAIEPYGYLGFRAANRLLSRKVVVQMLHETHPHQHSYFQ